MIMLVIAVLWLFGLAALPVAQHRAAGEAERPGLRPGRGWRQLALAAHAGGASGLLVWSLLCLGPASTIQIPSSEFAWLPFVTSYPGEMILAGAILGVGTAVGARRGPRWFMVALRVCGIVLLGWAGYGLILSAIPALDDTPVAVVQVQRGVAALGGAALTIALVDLFLYPLHDTPSKASVAERLLLLSCSLQIVLLAQTVFWDELLARVSGLAIR